MNQPETTAELALEFDAEPAQQTFIPRGEEHGEPGGGDKQLIARHTVERLVTIRNDAIMAYDEAYQAMTRAIGKLDDARQIQRAIIPRVNSFNHHQYERSGEETYVRKHREEMLYMIGVPAHEAFTERTREMIDVDAWAHVIELTSLEKLMDKKSKDEFRSSLQQSPPEFTEENVCATLQGFVAQADTIFRRGIAEAFSSLDRRFRSHLGFRVGSRIILDGAFDVQSGWWSHYRNQSDTLIDIERTMFMLDGKEPPEIYGGIVEVIRHDHEKHGGYRPRQGTVESDYFRIRRFLNGNCHIWFKRNDLVDKANRLLAEYYGEVIADDSPELHEEAEHAPQKHSHAMAKYYGHYPTPDRTADEIIGAAQLDYPAGPMRVLEPSAGEGNLAAKATALGHEVECIEIQAGLADVLKASGLYAKVICADFLQQQPGPDRVYDRIIMNPPFDRELDVEHVSHALRFLSEDGLLVAIMSAGTEYRSSARSRDFRNRIESMKGSWRDLPSASFASVGTNVNTRMLRVWGNGRQQTWW